ncbi:hypothetical protein [Caulobacter sp. RL271]|uniref:Uncharacterized protein n=1 Tax=Caulobacter segnis TaxID=88688 RepID=A0ABY4ZUG6_9CAUL|nr:hypothetical protein [Caulobacter segnis]USQ95571.1 hypothetical protein MZV50_24000 [Caulobacter segnis]
MLLSALALAALLQTAPVEGQKGYLLQHQPFDWAHPAKKRTLPFSKQAQAFTIEAARARDARRGTFRRPPQPRKTFVVNPQMVNCKSNGPELVASSETPRLQPLSKMPKAHGERAVARLVDGCPVAVTIAQAPASF